MKVLIIIPAYNEQKSIGDVLDRLIKVRLEGAEREIIVVNDGSTDRTAKEVSKRNVPILNHVINRGLGGALQTGFEYARRVKPDYIVTIDSDGQHNPQDIEKLIKPLLGGHADVVIGSRMLQNQKMPLDRKIINHLANIVTFLLWSIWITDSQSGLRAFTMKAVEKINIKTNRMEVSSELIKEIGKNHLRVAEVPISPIYTTYSRSKGQKNANALNILVKLLIHKFADIK